jgi:nitrite reductase/ring-hydroxylating ferredoxin subunit
VSGPDPEANRRVFLRNKDDMLIAIWNRCAHLGCPVAYSAGGDNYSCPCHGGAYDSLGIVVGGPPPRPLDRLAVKVVRDKKTISIGPKVDKSGTPVPGASTKGTKPDDRVLVGRAYSIDKKQHTYPLHGPGQPVTGLLANLYPFTSA